MVKNGLFQIKTNVMSFVINRIDKKQIIIIIQRLPYSIINSGVRPPHGFSLRKRNLLPT
jgi:hypothetical protein